MSLSELTGSLLGEKYQLRRELGHGAFGTVFEAREMLNGAVVREVAIKVYSPEASAGSDVDGMLADCSFPARILSSNAPLEVKRHFAQIYDFGFLNTPIGRCAFVAMELIRGAETLQDVIERYRDAGLHPRAELVIDYATQFFTGLAAAHAAGVLHRDIKGPNVMVDDGVIRIMDFGVGARTDQPGAAIKTTRSIMAPENFDGRHTAASDIYQAGLLFYELYTGIAPFVVHGIAAHATDSGPADQLMRVNFHYEPGRRVPGVHYNDRLDAILARCLAFNEMNRFPTAQAVLDALNQTDTLATAESALATGSAQTALESAEQTLANPDTDDARRVAALRIAAQAHAELGREDEALSHYRQALSLAGSSGVLFHDTTTFNAIVDATAEIYTRRGQAGMARLTRKKRR